MNAIRWSVRDRVTGKVTVIPAPDRKDKAAQGRLMAGLVMVSVLGGKGGCLAA